MTRITVDREVAIRQPTSADVLLLFGLIDANRDHLRRWTSWPDTINSVDDLVERFAAAASPAAPDGVTGGVVEFNGAPAGMLILTGPDPVDSVAELDFWLTEEAQGNGIISRACATLIETAFRERGAHRLVIRTARENARACAVAERLGFTMEGYQREAGRLHGGFCDLAVYSLLEHEWPAADSPSPSSPLSAQP